MRIYVQPVRSPEIAAAVVCKFTMYLRFNGLYNELCIVFGIHCTVHLFIYINIVEIYGIHNSMFRGVVTTFTSQLRLSFTRSAIAGIKS